MFFSAKEYHSWLNSSDGQWDRERIIGSRTRRISLRAVAKRLRAVKDAIVEREEFVDLDDYDDDGYGDGGEDIYKWLRPWHVVPKLKNWRPPAGDYGIGVEIELGFRTQSAARRVAQAVRNWRYLALDIEGPAYPIEATFAPFAYSKMNSRVQPFRYLKLLRERPTDVYQHDPASHTGTHINVSVRDAQYDNRRLERLREVLVSFSREQNYKYFGRNPYGYVNNYSGKYLEFKLFNSTTDSKALRRYIHIAVALTELATSEREITRESVLDALEAGYNKR